MLLICSSVIVKLQNWAPEIEVVVMLKFDEYGVTIQKYAQKMQIEGMANSVDPDQSSLIWVRTVCANIYG